MSSRKTRRAKRLAKAKGWQSPLQLEAVREMDPEGKIFVHHRIVDTLGRMLKSGTITEPMVDAGWVFERQFILAQLDLLRAPQHSPGAWQRTEGRPGQYMPRRP